MKKIPELLVPVGGKEHMRAAVENGADAVYMGGKLFNARQNAQNFSDEELLEAIQYAHVRGVNVYITLNTLISDSEMPEVLRYAKSAYKAGADALIVQDIGLADLLRKEMPDMPLHFSTQGSIYNIEGVKVAAAMGFERVVLARELSKEEIKHIVENAPVEIEIFVHGAICVSYSGQCLMSSMIGGRSGNRGQCAQPCRMQYELLEIDKDNQEEKIIKEKNHLMSPKDMCLITHLDEVIDTGASCLKIEGRMKSPEYVAIVTRVYRKYLDQYAKSPTQKIEVDAEDMQDLLQVFNRGGFTAGYFEKKQKGMLITPKRGKHWGTYLGTVTKYYPQKRYVQIKLENRLSMGDGIEIVNESLPGNIVTALKSGDTRIETGLKGDTILAGYIEGNVSIGDEVYKISDKNLNQEARESYEKGFSKKIGLNASIWLEIGKQIVLEVEEEECEKNNNISAIRVESEYICEKAINIPIGEARVREQIEKTGGTPFMISNCAIHLEAGVTAPVSELNKLRRLALEQMEKERANRYPNRAND